MDLLGVVAHENRQLCDWIVNVLVQSDYSETYLRTHKKVAVDVPAGGWAYGEIMGVVFQEYAGAAEMFAVVKGKWRTPIIGASVYLAPTHRAA